MRRPHRACWVALQLSLFCFVASIPAIAKADFGFPPPANLTTTQGILRGVIVTLAVELAIVSIYCKLRGASLWRCLTAGLVGNLITLPGVWFVSVLGWFFLAFIGAVLFVLVELAAGLVEGLIYHLIGRLPWRRAIWLGLGLNAATALLGVADQALNLQQRQGPPRPDPLQTQGPLDPG